MQSVSIEHNRCNPVKLSGTAFLIIGGVRTLNKAL